MILGNIRGLKRIPVRAFMNLFALCSYAPYVLVLFTPHSPGGSKKEN